MDASSKKMSRLVAESRATYEVYRTSHWQARGDDYYGDHLLFERLYNEAEEYTDALAERSVGLFGVETVDLSVQRKGMVDFFEPLEGLHPLKMAYMAARNFHRSLESTYKDLQGEMTLGLDDLIMSTSSTVEVHLYLLQQAGDVDVSKDARRIANRLKRK